MANYEDEYEGRPDQGQTPESCKRWNTDSGCLMLLVGCLGLMIYFIFFVWEHGDLAAYRGLTDYNGLFCGVDDSVKHQPYLFVCQDSSNGVLNVELPICVNKCPESEFTSRDCPIPGNPPSLANMNDYPTVKLLQKICVPAAPEKQLDVMSKLSGRGGIWYFLLVEQVFRNFWVVPVSFVAACVLGFSQLFLLRTLGMCMIWIGLAAAVGVPLIFGVHLMMTSYYGGPDGVQGTGDEQFAFRAGVAFTAVSLVFACWVNSSQRDLLLAQPCMRAAIECILDSKTLLLEPFIAVITRGVLVVVLVWGFFLLMSCGDWSGKVMTLPWPLLPFTAFFVVAGLWFLELCAAMSQYVAAYVAEEWFFTTFAKQEQKNEARWLGSAYLTGYRYHLGSLAKGAFVLPAVQGPRNFARYIALLSQGKSRLSQWVKNSMGFVIQAYEIHLARLSRSVYMDIALNSLPFEYAASHSLSVFAHEATDAIGMHGAAWIIEMSGAAGVTVLSVLVTHLISAWLRVHHQDSGYISNTLVCDLVSLAVACPVALHFMLVIAHTAESLLFCCAVERMRHPLRSMATDGSAFCCGPRDNEELGPTRHFHGHMPHTTSLLAAVSKAP